MSAFPSAPFAINSPAARKIALGGAMKIGSIRRPKYSQITKNTSTEVMRMALGLSSSCAQRCAAVTFGAGMDLRGVMSVGLMLHRS